MQCPQCLSHNDGSVAFCGQCGSRLDPPVKEGRGSVTSSSGRRPAVAILLSMALIGAIWWSTNRPGDSSGDSSSSSGRSAAVDSDDPGRLPDDARQNPTAFTDGSSTGASLPEVDSEMIRDLDPGDVRRLRSISSGVLTAKDRWGRVLAQSAVTVSASGWVAVPRRLVLGAETWTIATTSGEGELADGIWRPGEEIGLWRREVESEFAPEVRGAAELVAWSDEDVLLWRGLTSSGVHQVDPTGLAPAGDYFRFPLESIADSRGEAPSGGWNVGVLVQEGGIVGWTFPESIARDAFLWRGDDGDTLQSDQTVENFYRLTFAGGREEATAEALHEADPLRASQALIAAWRLAPRLQPEETPNHLREEALLDELLERVVALRDQGKTLEVVRLLPSQTIGELRDERILVVAVSVLAQQSGSAPAIDLAERWWPTLVTAGSEAEQVLNELLPQLYGQLLYDLISATQYDRAWSVFNKAQPLYPNDPNLHLRGVELYIADGNWFDAERMIDERRYPAKLNDRVTVLRQKIRELKQLEGKIVIRFPPGSRQVQVVAVLNGSVNQRFIVDTGATGTTIPSAAARAMGIRITNQTPRVRVRTAGGEVLAADITLDAVSLQGWSIPNVRVLVHDLPGMADLGLLGINYLQNFAVDLRTNEGILVLTPR